MSGEVELGGDHLRRSLEVTGGSSTQGQGRRHLPGGHAAFQRATGLDVTQESPEADRALIQGAVDMDMPQFPALEAGLMVSGVVTGKRCVVVAACPPDFSAFKGSFFVFG